MNSEQIEFDLFNIGISYLLCECRGKVDTKHQQQQTVVVLVAVVVQLAKAKFKTTTTMAAGITRSCLIEGTGRPRTLYRGPGFRTGTGLELGLGLGPGPGAGPALYVAKSVALLTCLPCACSAVMTRRTTKSQRRHFPQCEQVSYQRNKSCSRRNSIKCICMSLTLQNICNLDTRLTTERVRERERARDLLNIWE